MSTQKDGKHYLHILDAKNDTLFIPAFPKSLKSAEFYDSGESVPFKQIEEGVFLYLKEEDWQPIDTIIEMEMET